MEQLTVQAFIDKRWQDIAVLSFRLADKANFDDVELTYLRDYALDYFDKDDHHAVSLNLPVSFFGSNTLSNSGSLISSSIISRSSNFKSLSFLDDIMPNGASRRFWVNYLDIANLDAGQQNFRLLKYGTLSPIGNLRIKESLPERSVMAEKLYFTVNDVKNRASDFLDYAQQRGAVAGGATGAGGEAPKLLIRMKDENKIWIDAYQDDLKNHDIHYLVKYPRGSPRTEVDCNILRAEYGFYQELTAMGFETIPVKNMRLEEGDFYPSLWLPRFDIKINQGGEIERFAMESVYSILGKLAGSSLDHEETIRQLIQKILASHMVQNDGFEFDIKQFVIEWVLRDLLNILFGNSDNHGRNTAFIRYQSEIKLAPIYDFAPMKADPEGIARSMKWNRHVEAGGEYNFIGIAELLDDLVPATELLTALSATAKQCLDLKERLIARAIPNQILTMSGIGFDYIPERLARWGLL